MADKKDVKTDEKKKDVKAEDKKKDDKSDECKLEEKKPERDIKKLIEQAEEDLKKEKETGVSAGSKKAAAACCTDWHRLAFFAIPLAVVYLPWVTRILRCPPKCCPPARCCPPRPPVCPPEKRCCAPPPGVKAKRQCQPLADPCEKLLKCAKKPKVSE